MKPLVIAIAGILALGGGAVAGVLLGKGGDHQGDGTTEQAFRREPRVRDAFLKILFNMAAEGAFSQDIFAPDTQTELRGRLLNAAREIIGDSVNAVLISDFLKQDR